MDVLGSWSWRLHLPGSTGFIPAHPRPQGHLSRSLLRLRPHPTKGPPSGPLLLSPRENARQQPNLGFLRAFNPLPSCLRGFHGAGWPEGRTRGTTSKLLGKNFLLTAGKLSQLQPGVGHCPSLFFKFSFLFLACAGRATTLSITARFPPHRKWINPNMAAQNPLSLNPQPVLPAETRRMAGRDLAPPRSDKRARSCLNSGEFLGAFQTRSACRSVAKRTLIYYKVLFFSLGGLACLSAEWYRCCLTLSVLEVEH